jgi:FAD/FMN-containing dehydrogenase
VHGVVTARNYYVLSLMRCLCNSGIVSVKPMIDRRPALIARCASPGGVVQAVEFARKHDLLVSIRGGGHNIAGNAVCDDGLMIDLSLMKSVQVDPNARRATVEPGCTLADFDAAAQVHGLATPLGINSTTGVAGLTLGGGFGWLSRKHGLTVDNLLSADVVTADGKVVTASARSNEDLFWGLRGGGGNFGVVTSFEFKAHPVSTVLAGPVLYPLEKSREALQFYRDFMDKAPDEMNAFFAFLIVPPGPPFPEHLHGKTVCGIVACYVGPLDQGDGVVRPLRQFGPPLVDFIGPIPYPALQSMFDALVPAGLQNYWKADFVEKLSDPVIDAHVKYGPSIPHVSSAMHIYPVSGAAGRVKNEDTAFFHRHAKYVHVLAAMYPDPADTPKNVAWVRDYWAALHPHSTGGAYVNFLMEEGEDRVRGTYGGNYDRLATLKKKYDQTNLFRMNQNIKPQA